MEKIRLASLFAVIALTLIAASCGTSSNSSQGQLQSIAVNPPTADAQNYPNGEVPFQATGYYINPSHTVTPQPATWVACSQNAPTSDVSVSKSGSAQCASEALGKYAINAFVLTNCTAITACGGGCTVAGSAQLTCP
jgi:hypothetical protein